MDAQGIVYAVTIRAKVRFVRAVKRMTALFLEQ